MADKKPYFPTAARRKRDLDNEIEKGSGGASKPKKASSPRKDFNNPFGLKSRENNTPKSKKK